MTAKLMKMNCPKAKAKFYTQMAPSLKVTLQKEYLMGRENSALMMTMFMKVNGHMVCKVVTAPTLMQLGTTTRANGLPTQRKAKVQKHG